MVERIPLSHQSIWKYMTDDKFWFRLHFHLGTPLPILFPLRPDFIFIKDGQR